MRILFLSHSYPPVVGGVETQNYNLAKNLGNIASVTIIANKKGKKALPFFLFYCFFRSLLQMYNHDVCLCGNGVLAPVARALKFYHPKKRFFCVVHGLDVTYADRKGLLPYVYRICNISSLKKMDRLFMVGNSTIAEAAKHGIPEKKCKFIPNGVEIDDFREDHTKDELANLIQSDLTDKKVILRFGRFVKHKGSSWFIKQVMPLLPENVLLVVAGNRVAKTTAGDSDDYEVCRNYIKENNLVERVILLPSIPQHDVKVLLNTVDLVVSPNIKVPGTMEGFGLNVIEAGACSRVVIASKLEGLADAIENGQNGILVEPGDAEAWKRKIIAIFNAGDDFIEKFGQRTFRYNAKNFSWSGIAKRYYKAMETSNEL